MVPINNHEDNSTVPPTPNVTRLLLSPFRAARYTLRSTLERLGSRGRAAAATTLTALSQGSKISSSSDSRTSAVGGTGVQSVAPTSNYSTILPRGVAGGGTTAGAAVAGVGCTTAAAAVVGVGGTAASMVGRARVAGTATGTLARGTGAAATNMPRGRGNSGTAPPNVHGGVKNYTEYEISSLLQCIRRVLPIGNDQWR
jgi:hypothetical protein